MQINDDKMEELSPDKKRELRRKRRIQSQRIAYISLFFLVLIIVATAVLGFVFAKERMENKQEQEIQYSVSESEETPEEIPDKSAEEMDAEITQAGDVGETMVSTEYTDEMLLDEVVESVIAEMTLEEKVAGLFVVTPESITGVSQVIQAGDGTKSALEKYPVGGLIYSKKNIQSEEQVKKMVSNSQAFSKYPLFVAADESLAESSQLASYGINMKLVSVANFEEDNGTCICIKGFPCQDTQTWEKQNGLPVVEHTLEDLKQEELVPYISAIERGVEMIMVGHMALPQVVGEHTSITMASEVITDFLRVEQGYNGVIITDAMNIEAITEYYGAEEAAIKAFRAGADMVLMPENFETAYQGVIAAVQDGTISEDRINDSLKRVFRIKYADRVVE